MYCGVPTMAPSIVAPAAAVSRRKAGRAPGGGRGRPGAAVGRAIPKSMITRVLVDDHDVGRLEIAVDDARFVRGDEAGGDVADDAKRRRNRSVPRALEHAREVGALEVRHRDVLDAVDLAEIVNAHDVLVRDLPREHQLLLEAALHLARHAPRSRVASGRMTLSATAMPSSASQAWYTAPMPPTPSRRMM